MVVQVPWNGDSNLYALGKSKNLECSPLISLYDTFHWVF